jgi:hypothetical protein
MSLRFTQLLAGLATASLGLVLAGAHGCGGEEQRDQHYGTDAGAEYRGPEAGTVSLDASSDGADDAAFAEASATAQILAETADSADASAAPRR